MSAEPKMRRHDDSPLDAVARGLATGMSRREALRAGGSALIGALALSPVDAMAAVTGRCPKHRVSCHGTCCPKGEICLPPKHHGGHPHCGCPAHHSRCAGKCVNTHSDARNCGACGHHCGSGEVCSSGQCTTTCAAGETMCAGACVTLASDPRNCGACGHACAAGEVCSAGQCATSCAVGLTQCGASCVNLMTDPSHCGSCSTPCPGGGTCANGICSCPSGTTLCNGSCVNFQTDVNNCGGCGTKCSTCFSTPSCVSGTCHNSCAPNWVNCSGNPLDGCNCLGTTCNGMCCATGACNPSTCP